MSQPVNICDHLTHPPHPSPGNFAVDREKSLIDTGWGDKLIVIATFAVSRLAEGTTIGVGEKSVQPFPLLSSLVSQVRLPGYAKQNNCAMAAGSTGGAGPPLPTFI